MRRRRLHSIGKRRNPEHVGYVTAHYWLEQQRGLPSEYECVGCGETAAHWAFDNQEPYLVDTTRKYPLKYSEDPMRYSPMCRRCHAAMDLRLEVCKKGLHPMTEDNLYFWPSGKRTCKACKLEGGREYMRNRRAAAAVA